MSTHSSTGPAFLGRLAIVEEKWFQNFIIGVIIFNAILLGLETSKHMSENYGDVLHLLDSICLSIFVVELLMKMAFYRTRFVRSGWNIFDFIIVAIALLPATGQLSVLRSLRILRALRLLSSVPSLRRIINALISAMPGVGSAAMLLSIIFYIFAVMATNVFGPEFPEWFGSLGASMYTLFQIMTLESWSMGIVRPVMESFPYAWIFFIPFILIATFTVLNLFIGIIVDAMATAKEMENAEKHGDERKTTVDNIEQINSRLKAIESSIASLASKSA